MGDASEHVERLIGDLKRLLGECRALRPAFQRQDSAPPLDDAAEAQRLCYDNILLAAETGLRIATQRIARLLDVIRPVQTHSDELARVSAMIAADNMRLATYILTINELTRDLCGELAALKVHCEEPIIVPVTVVGRETLATIAARAGHAQDAIETILRSDQFLPPATAQSPEEWLRRSLGDLGNAGERQ